MVPVQNVSGQRQRELWRFWHFFKSEYSIQDRAGSPVISFSCWKRGVTQSKRTLEDGQRCERQVRP